MASRTSNPTPPSLDDPLKSTLGTASRVRTARDKRANEHERAGTTAARRNDLLPELRIVERRLSELVRPARRLRKFGLDDIIEAANVIGSKGFLQPIFISRDGKTIIDGELRYEAARWLGLETVPCIMTDCLSPQEERAVRIALNRLGQRREWDLGALRVELEELIIDDEPIELLGFDAIELDQILIDDTDPEPEADVEPDKTLTPVCKPNDLWLVGRHKLLCGDARHPASYEELMEEGEACQLLLCDPPYNIEVSKIVSTSHREFVQASGEMSSDEFFGFLGKFLASARDRMVDGAIGFVFMDWRQVELLLRAGRENDLELMNIVAWVKANAGMGSFYRSQHELIAVFKRPGQHKNRIQLGSKGRNRANVWFAPGAGTMGSDAREMLKEHPTSKPVQLLVDAIIDTTDPEDIVLDCFGGSGSTLIAAEKAGRTARIMEFDPLYCDVILRRWMALDKPEPVLADTGQTFSDAMFERANCDDDED